MELLLGKMEEQLKNLEDNSVDSIVTDPPYGIDFMGKKWDYKVPTKDMWSECWRVLKPGGHLISFSSARTYHRMAVEVEDAGFDIRDQIMWVYGSGFPKSYNIGLNYDKKHGIEREVLGDNPNSRPNVDVDNQTHDYGMTGKVNKLTRGTGPWEGWGTGLKPAHEPMVLARKPFSEKTIIANVDKWGVGGINIDASRVDSDDNFDNVAINKNPSQYGFVKLSNAAPGGNAEAIDKLKEMGRFPANFIHDGSQDVLDLFPDSKGGHWHDQKTTGGGKSWGGKSEYKGTGPKDKGDGSAARFFYVPKVSKKDRNEGLDGVVEETRKPAGDFRPSYDQDGTTGTAYGRWGTGLNTHPTVKPTDLMHYLIRMVTPAGGTVLDPFMGSGSTGKAAIRNGYNFIGIEMEEDSFEVAKARIEYESTTRDS